MSTLGMNSIMPIVKFKQDRFLPFNTLKAILDLISFIGWAYFITSMRWLRHYLKKDKENFNSLFVKLVGIKELVINDEENDFKCICVYFTLRKRLIGVISYSYRQKEKK